MNKLQRVPRKEAGELKELGFDVALSSFYNADGDLIGTSFSADQNSFLGRVSAPQIHIVFEWLDTKGIYCGVFPVYDIKNELHWKFTINQYEDFIKLSFDTRQIAELEVLREAIKILRVENENRRL